MSVLVQDVDLTIHVGDALEVLRSLPAESVDLVATSPPFYALRDYGTGTWEGGDEGCDHAGRKMVGDLTGPNASGDSFRNSSRYSHQDEDATAVVCGKCGARRVDRQIGLEATPDGWVAALVAVFAECRRVLRPSGSMFVECGDSYTSGGRSDYGPQNGKQQTNAGSLGVARLPTPLGLKAKDLIGQPFLLAFALRADGWYWRGCYPWAKPNAMPESAKDRCTTAHSYVLHFAKSARYFFDGDAIAEPAAWERWGDQTVPKYEGTDTASGWMQPKTKAELQKAAQTTGNGASDRKRAFTAATVHLDAAYPAMKHPRSVWTIPTRGFPGAHFATWPEALAERIIKAGCPEGGTVLDPFGGAGTTALVARRHGRRSILIELNHDYALMAAERCSQLSLLADGAAA